MKFKLGVLLTIKIIVCLFFISSTLKIQAQDKPNVVYILVDDLGYGDVGCYGATKVKTPNIDKLASEGKMFTDAHSASAVCTPRDMPCLLDNIRFAAITEKEFGDQHPLAQNY